MVSGDPRVSRKSGRDSHGRLNRKLALRCQDKVWLKWIEGMKQNFWKAREFCVFALRCVQDESERLLCTSVRSDTEWRGFAKCAFNCLQFPSWWMGKDKTTFKRIIDHEYQANPKICTAVTSSCSSGFVARCFLRTGELAGGQLTCCADLRFLLGRTLSVDACGIPHEPPVLPVQRIQCG